MFTNPFERKHSSLRQTLDRIIKVGEARLSFRKKQGLSGSKSGGSITSVNSSSSTSGFQVKFNEKR